MSYNFRVVDSNKLHIELKVGTSYSQVRDLTCTVAREAMSDPLYKPVRLSEREVIWVQSEELDTFLKKEGIIANLRELNEDQIYGLLKVALTAALCKATMSPQRTLSLFDFKPMGGSESGKLIESCSRSLKINNKGLILGLMARFPKILLLLDPALKVDPSFIAQLTDMLEFSYVLTKVPELTCDKDFAKVLMSIKGSYLENLSLDLKRDPEIVKIAVAQNGLALKYASPELKADPEIVKIAVARNGMALEFASDELRADPEIVKIAVAQDGLALLKALPELIADPEVVKIAVAQDAMALLFASPELRADPEVVKIAVARNGRVLAYASDELRADPEIVKIAVAQNGLALEDASDELRADPEIVAIAVMNNPVARQYINKSVPDDALLAIAKKLLFVSPLIAFLWIQDPILIHLEPAFFECAITSTLDRYRGTGANEIKLSAMLANLILGYKNIELKMFFIASLVKGPDVDLRIYHTIKQLSHLVEKGHITEAQTKHLLLPLFLIVNLDVDPKLQEDLAIYLQKNQQLLKDANRLQTMLFFLKNITEQEGISKEERTRILRGVMTDGDFKTEIIDRMKYLGTLIKSGKTTSEIAKFDTKSLAELAVSKLEEVGILSLPSGKEARDAALHEFGTKILNGRMFASLVIYIERHQGNPVMMKLIKQFVSLVIEGRFKNYRNEYNSHIRYLSPSQRHAWETSLKSEAAAQGDVSSFEPKSFCMMKLVTDGHAGELLKRVSAYLQDKEASVEDPRELEKKVLALIEETDSEKQQKLLEEIQTLLPEEHEFRNDVHGAIQSFLGAKKESNFTFVDSDDHEDLFLCGTEVLGSCQRVDGDSKLNQCLMGYVLDGKIRLLAIKDSSGKIAARAILKLLLTDENKPALFLERLYPDDRFSQFIIKQAKKKARALGVDLYVSEGDSILRSLGNAAGVEYEDGRTIGYGVFHVNDGVYRISAKKLNL